MKFQTEYLVDFGKRDPDSMVDNQFHERWSPRSFQKIKIPENIVESIMDAARWSPSSFNEQPWLFVTSGNDVEFDLFLNLLTEKNQIWAKNAGLLGFIFAKRFFAHNNEPNRFCAFDCGAAWMGLTLQARKFGLYTHGMGGIKKDEIGPALNVPAEQYEVICGFALGEIDMPQSLPEEFAMKEFPTPRKPLDEIWKKGRFT